MTLFKTRMSTHLLSLPSLQLKPLSTKKMYLVKWPLLEARLGLTTWSPYFLQSRSDTNPCIAMLNVKTVLCHDPFGSPITFEDIYYNFPILSSICRWTFHYICLFWWFLLIWIWSNFISCPWSHYHQNKLSIGINQRFYLVCKNNTDGPFPVTIYDIIFHLLPILFIGTLMGLQITGPNIWPTQNHFTYI